MFAFVGFILVVLLGKAFHLCEEHLCQGGSGPVVCLVVDKAKQISCTEGGFRLMTLALCTCVPPFLSGESCTSFLLLLSEGPVGWGCFQPCPRPRIK